LLSNRLRNANIGSPSSPSLIYANKKTSPQYLWASTYKTLKKIATSDMSTVLSAPINSVSVKNLSGYGIYWDGTNVWVTASDSAGDCLPYLMKIDGVTGAILGTYQLGALDSWLSQCCIVGDYIWVADYDYACLIKVQRSDGAVVGSYTVGTYPEYVHYDGTNIWVSDNSSGKIYKVSPSSGAVLGNYVVTSPYHICSDGTYLWVGSGTTKVAKVTISDGSIVGNYTVNNMGGNCYDGAGSVWCAGFSNKYLTKVRTSDGTALNTVSTGTVIGNYVTSDSAFVWLGGYSAGAGSVYKHRISDGVLVGSYTLSGEELGSYGCVCLTSTA
jgi:hypothetical protein